MATRKPVVNEIKPGKSWSVYWELGDTPALTSNNTLTTNTRFTCGEKVYKVRFTLFGACNGWNLNLDFETMKGNG